MTTRRNDPQYCEPDMSAMSEAEQRRFILLNLSNPWWRLNNLYKIQDEKGNLVTFRMRPAQRRLFRNMHNKNIILKARQLGFSTSIDIYLLDQALFTPHLKCGIVAQDKAAAGEIFRTKIAIPFDNLPGWLRASFTVVERRGGANGGFILLVTDPVFRWQPHFVQVLSSVCISPNTARFARNTLRRRRSFAPVRLTRWRKSALFLMNPPRRAWAVITILCAWLPLSWSRLG